MNEYDKTFDPKVLIGRCHLISRFNDFALYLGTQLVYEHISLTVCLLMTRPLTLIILGHCDLISHFCDFALCPGTGYMNILLHNMSETLKP